MPENIAEILNTLALKLGVASELLWLVLLKQATVSAITDIIMTTLYVILIMFAYKLLLLKTTKFKVIDKYGDEVLIREWNDDRMPVVLWTLFLSCFLIIFILVVNNITNIVTAIANPEYWALNKIMGLIKCK